MALPTTRLAHKFIFGLNGDVHDNVVFSDESTLLYVAGHNLVIYNTLEKRQQFITGNDNTEGITALAICPNRRYCAVAERADRAVVFIYDLRSLRKRKNLQFTDGSFHEYVSMAFSYDNQLLLTLGGAPDWTLVCWDWTKAKAKSHVQAAEGYPLYHCSFSPLDSTVAVTTGSGGMLKFFRVTEQEMRAMPPPRGKSPHNYLCHAWLAQPEDHILLGTDGGELVVFESGSFLTYLADAPGEGKPVHSVASHGAGFVCGLSHGTFRMYLYSPDAQEAKDMFQCAQSWSIETEAYVQSIVLNPGEDMLAATLSDHQLYSLSLTTTTQHQALRTEDMKPVVSLFHGPGHITGMDVAIRKPLVVTCSLDRTVRVWNYATNRAECQKTFQEEPWSCALHPSGLHIAVGFSDKLRLMNLLMDDIRAYKEIGIKQCKEVRFSNGGHYFAAVNGNVITIYQFYTCEKEVDLRAHSNKVRHIWWGPEDVNLLSCGQDGAIYYWEVEEGKRLADFVKKGTIYNSVIGTNHDLVYVVGNDQNLKELTLHDLQVQKDIPAGLLLGQVVLSQSKHLLFTGTSEEGKPGCVRAYNCPASEEHHEYPCMGAMVTRMVISTDERFLMVADAGGCLCIFEIKDRQDRGARGTPLLSSDGQSGEQWSEEILVTKPDLDERAALTTELQNKVDELITHSEYQLRLKEMNHNEKIKELTEKFTQDLDQSKNKYELLREEKNDMEMEMEDRLKQMDDNHQHELQELESAYQQKIMAEVERYQKLSHELTTQKSKWEEQRMLIQQTHEKYTKELKEDFERKLEEDHNLRIQFEEDKLDLQKEFDETKDQLEDDIDTEIQNLRGKYEEQLSQEREATLRFKGENGIMRKKFTVLQKEIEDQKEEINSLLEKGHELQNQIKALEGEIASHKREIKDRDDKIGEKEKKIYELKKKNQELEKFKFVLNYKIKELKQQMEPRESEIARMKEDIKKMDQALERFHKSNAQLDNTIGELREKLDTLQKEILDQRQKISEQESTINSFKKDLHECVQCIQDPPRLKTSFDRLYTTYVSDDIPKSEMDVKVRHEYHRHKEFLEENLESLKMQFAADASAHKTANSKLMQENLVLIKEINQQREDNKEAKRMLQAQIGMLKRYGRKKLQSPPIGEPQSDFNLATTGAGEGEDYFAKMEENKARIAELRLAIRQLENLMVANKPYAKEVLPPMDGSYDPPSNNPDA
eukprot:CAMPEP_0117801652 /NCGR_PEP_ID=MMETSP0948-20121206/15215_1 /TAXON_ID=44440 /ORGANISM="Chattonella subsalsa, Strain CCMP2191" /LENGTH=1212 /DNA_ID=CAMNT_0005634207 /DNA_START=27 /DNA_END=3665 /DNA_ORIENTATION=-